MIPLINLKLGLKILITNSNFIPEKRDKSGLIIIRHSPGKKRQITDKMDS